SSSRYFPVMEGSKLTKPVMLPPGRDMLATKPWPTGSTMFPKMIGMVLVCCFSICVVDELDEKITSGFAATISFANLLSVFMSVPPQPKSMPTLRPSTHPSFCRPARRAATQRWASTLSSVSCNSAASRRIRSPCCALSASGHAAAAPPSSVMNARLCRERSIVRGDEDRIMIRPSSRPEARSLLGCQTVNELGAPVASSIPEQLPGHEPASARMGYEDGHALFLRYRRVEGPLGRGGAA